MRGVEGQEGGAYLGFVLFAGICSFVSDIAGMSWLLW